MLQKTGPLGGLLQYMNYLQKGLAVHTDNLSRIDIPNAQAKELKPFAEQLDKAVSGARISKTHSSHLGAKGSSFSDFATQETKNARVSYSGGNISREDEIGKVNDVTTNYLKATRLYQKGLNMVKTILGSKG